jgi:hypothetical protein
MDDLHLQMWTGLPRWRQPHLLASGSFGSIDVPESTKLRFAKVLKYRASASLACAGSHVTAACPVATFPLLAASPVRRTRAMDMVFIAFCSHGAKATPGTGNECRRHHDSSFQFCDP